ncbi:two-component system histidine kinase PnpS [Niallia endozanthoxylica]|uniref:histidine kinase n=1 Tax=Niallia endozanthoxylica TaxID=2036016 RepID=A0A5J5I9T0_9BACI|nr:ATP-binding protein [Niallia endozanthoxylica]KAA9031713.1 cell wall metabolism sensor histidine kinase WalK [Niallia endozanthoxylica]
MTKFRTRLFFTLITILVIVLVCLGLILGQLFKHYYINTFDERLKKENALVASYIEDQGGIDEFSQEKISAISSVLDARITVIDREGNIVSDSGELDDISKENDKNVIEAIIENDTDYVNELNDSTLINDFHTKYYWKPINTNDSNSGFVLISTKMTELKKAYSQTGWLLTICFSFAFIVIIILGRMIMNRYAKPIERATNVAYELAKGNYQARTYEDQVGEIGMLNSSLNILARNLQDMRKSHEMQKDRLSTLIESIGSGLLLIDSRGYISLINRTYKEVFNVKTSEYLYKLYYEVIEHRDIKRMIEDIFMTEQKLKKQVVIPLKIERRHFEVYGVPIIGTNDVWKGILLVFHDITEIKKLEQMRKDFVANVSHELKTPVTSIKGFSETLLDGAMENKDTLEAFLNIILKESDRLQSLINDLLELSKIEHEGFSLTLQTFNLTDLLEDTIRMMEGKAKDKNITILFETHPSQLSLEGDVYRLKQVFINIISNAVLYTPIGGKVYINVEETKKTVIVHIKDTGMGIEEKEIPRIFERFYRVNKARDRDSGGTGLGLAIVKHLLEAHKGKITVDSELGKYTVFSIELLKKIPHK